MEGNREARKQSKKKNEAIKEVGGNDRRERDFSEDYYEKSETLSNNNQASEAEMDIDYGPNN